MASTILSDNGVSSGSAGLKSSADSTGVLALQTSTSGGAATTALTIDTSQNVGIGASPTAAAKLTVVGDGSFTGSNGPTGNTQGVRILGTNTSAGAVTIDAFAYGSNSYGSLYLNTSNGGTPTMALTAGQNVGIGTTSPAVKLQVNGGGDSPTDTNQTARFFSTDALAANKGGSILFGGVYTGSTTAGWGGIAGLKNNATDGDYGSYLAFYTRLNGSAIAERMRINSSGAVLIGATANVSGSPALYVFAGTTTGKAGAIIRNNAEGAGPAYIGFQGYDWVQGAVWHDRNAGYSVALATNPNTTDLSINGCIARVYVENAGNFLPTSDNTYSLGKSGQRFSAVWAANGTIQTSDLNAKTDIIDSPLGLNFINSLRSVAYKFKVGGNTVQANPKDQSKPIVTPIAGKRQHFGLIAQEVKEVLPEGVDFGGWVQTDLNDENSEQGLRYEEFIAPLIKAIQELKAINDTQAETINALTARIVALEQA